MNPKILRLFERESQAFFRKHGPVVSVEDMPVSNHKGGVGRAKKLSAARRSQIATEGGKARVKDLSAAQVANLGKKGGQTRAANLTQAERSDIARAAARARWAAKKGDRA